MFGSSPIKIQDQTKRGPIGDAMKSVPDPRRQKDSRASPSLIIRLFDLLPPLAAEIYQALKKLVGVWPYVRSLLQVPVQCQPPDSKARNTNIQLLEQEWLISLHSQVIGASKQDE
jgi:hypothetical protein